MANDFASMKKNSKNASNLLAKELEKVTKGGGENSYKDDRMWQPEVDKTGKLRIVPPPSDRSVLSAKPITNFGTVAMMMTRTSPVTASGSCHTSATFSSLMTL